MRRFRIRRLSENHYYAMGTPPVEQPLSVVSRDMIASVFAQEEKRGSKDLSVCFTGHRLIPDEMQDLLRKRLGAVLEKLYEQGYRRFICGAALGFDLLSAESVMNLMEQHEGVRLSVAIPCPTQTRSWPQQDLERYERMLVAAEEIHVLAPQYYLGCMQVRNRFMVDRSAFCLCYLTNEKGGTMSTVAYAMESSCPVLNLAMEDACEAFVCGE